MTVFIFASSWWIISARKWFTGPIRTVSEDSSTTTYDEKQEQQYDEHEKQFTVINTQGDS